MKKRWFFLWLDKSLSQSIWRQILLLLILMTVSFLISYWLLFWTGCCCEVIDYCDSNHIKRFVFPIYLLIDANALNNLYDGDVLHGWMMFFSVLTYLLGMFIFNGLIIGVITNYISHRVQNHNDGITHYLKSGHYVIMGYDDMVPSIITEIFKDKTPDVLLLSSYDAKKIKEKLKKSVAKNQLDHIIVNYGQRTASEYYKDIKLEAAQEIFIVGDRSRPYHDAVNVECVGSICDYLKDCKNKKHLQRITCVFEDLDTYAAFKTSEIFGDVRDLGIEFVPYNFYNGWAEQVFVTRNYKEKSNPQKEIEYPSVYGDGITPDCEKQVHLVFVGITYFSVAFAMEAAHLLHFPNIEKEDKKQTRVTRITFIDQVADKEMLLFKTRNRHFLEVQDVMYQDMSNEKSMYNGELGKLEPATNTKNFLDVEFEFIKGDVYAENIQDLLSKWACDDKQYLSVFLAQSDQRKNFVMGMNMPDELYENDVKIFIRQDRADNFVTNLRLADETDFDYYRVENQELKKYNRKGRYANIYPFGMDDMAYCTDERVFRQAKLINYLYDTADYSTNKFKDIKKLDANPDLWTEVDKHWRKLTVALKWSNLYCAYSFRCKCDSLKAMCGFTEENVERLAEVEHNRWNVEKLLMGYRRAEPEEDMCLHKDFADKLKKNKDLFIHHYIRPFADLDDTVKQLDREITKYIPWILEMTEK